MKWPRVTVGSIKAEVRHSLVGGPFGSDLTTRDYIEEGGVPVIRGGNLPEDRSFNGDDFVFVREEKADQLIANNAHAGDVIFTQRGTLGQVGLVPSDTPFPRYLISQSQMKLTVDARKADAKFVYYWFRHPDTVQNIKNHAITSGVPHINLGLLREFEIPLPSVDVQRKIVGVLSTYDDLIENNRRRTTLLEESARQLYREWFVRLRFPGHEHKRITDGVPEGWESIQLSSIIKVTHGFAFQGDYFSEIPTSRVLTTPGNFRIGGGIKVDKLKFYSDEGPLESTYVLAPMDLILTMTDLSQMGDTLGFPAFVPTLDGRSFLHNQRVGKVVPEGQFFPKHFLYCLFCDDRYRYHVVGAATGTSVKHTSPKRILSYVTTLPSRGGLIASFEALVGPLFQQINCLIATNHRLRAARDLLLPGLLSGEITV
jgi:type I restriction enzyme S subunit